MFVPPFRPTAAAPTSTGIRSEKVPDATPAATPQPLMLLPADGHPLKVPVVVPASRNGAPASVMPAGNESATKIDAVVGPLATVMSSV
jgi:hypothetical protein